MTMTALSSDQIRKLMAERALGGGNIAEEDKPHNRWPGKANWLKLAKAVDNKLPQVTFGNGDLFDIFYDRDPNAVWIRLHNGVYAPCGWFSYKKLREAKEQAHIKLEPK